MAEQQEKSFQKQDLVFQNTKDLLMKKTEKGARFYKTVGLGKLHPHIIGFKIPKEAVTGTYIDKKCPFTSNVNIRGRILKGICISTKMRNTIVIRRDYLHYVRKYKRFEKRYS